MEPSLSSSWRDFLPSGALGGLDPDDAHHRRLTHARLNFGRSLLTDREFEILQQLLQGKSVGFIAQYLKITVSTVKVHRKHIYAKLNIKSQSELFALFLKVIAGTCDEAGVDPLDAYSRSQPISGTLTDD